MSYGGGRNYISIKLYDMLSPIYVRVGATLPIKFSQRNSPIIRIKYGR